MIDKLTRSWACLNARTIGSEAYFWAALESRALYEGMAPVISKWVRGSVLDLGAGKMAWKTLLSAQARQYVSSDIETRHPDLNVVVDATSALPFRDESFTVVFCCCVLEHVPDPQKAVIEIFRVLETGGTAIISLPFVFQMHDAPSDYYRFTKYGVEMLASSADFEVAEIVTIGGLFHLFFNIPSVLMSVLLDECGLKRLIRPATSFWLGSARLLDGVFRLKEPFASNYIAVFRKKSAIRNRAGREF
jgi:SAM-dependent methyltransferase